MNEIDAFAELKSVAAEGNRRRDQARTTVIVLFLVALLQIASTITLGAFVVSWRHQDKKANTARIADEAIRAKRSEDLYAKENDTNNVVRALAGQPPAPPIIPPPVPTTTTTLAPRRDRPASTAPVGAQRRSAPTTASNPSPPSSAQPAQPQPPPSTPPTTRCLTVVLGVCVP